MDETPREKWAGIFGGVVSIIPAMIVAGFMPEWDVLPFAGWLAVAGHRRPARRGAGMILFSKWALPRTRTVTTDDREPARRTGP